MTKLDRLARSLSDARAVADELTVRHVRLNLEPQSGWVHYVPDAATAMREAKAAIGEQDVLVHGAGGAPGASSVPSSGPVMGRSGGLTQMPRRA
ncbi:MAG: hypothetical protein ACRDPB_06485 [Nocardioidaceae bacterium]